MLIGSGFGMLAVIVGAFGAHGLKSVLDANNRLDTFETAVKYQFYHALALVLLGILMNQFQHRSFILSGWGFVIGILLFSGSLYILSLTGMNKLGAVAPIGGLAFVIGWGALIWGIIKSV